MSFDTMEIERHLLKILTSNKLIARLHIMDVRPEWFTGIRGTIIEIVQSEFKNTGSLVSQALYEAEVNKRFPDPNSQDSERKRRMTEWTLVRGVHVAENAEALIERLKEREQIGKITDICQKTLDALKSGDPNAAAQILRGESILLNTNDAGEKPLIEVTDVDSIEKRINDKRTDPGKYAGIKTGFTRFDNKTGGLFPAEMTLISAVTGVGKSTLIKQLGVNVACGRFQPGDPTTVYKGRNVLHITNEEHRDQVQEKYNALLAEIDYFGIKNATITDDEYKRWKKHMVAMKAENDLGRIFIKEIPQFTSISEVYRAFYDLQQKGINIGMILLDYLDHMAPNQKAWGENDEQAKKASDFKSMTIDLYVPGVTATQAATIVDARQERGQKFGKMNIYGSKRPIHASNTVMGILMLRDDQDQLRSNGGDRDALEECDKFWSIEIMKNRDGPPFSFEARHVVRTGRVKQEAVSAPPLTTTGAPVATPTAPGTPMVPASDAPPPAAAFAAAVAEIKAEQEESAGRPTISKDEPIKPEEPQTDDMKDDDDDNESAIDRLKRLGLM